MSLNIVHKRIAPSATDTVTNTTSETAFTKTLSFPAQIFRVGDKVVGRARATIVDANSTDTFAFKVYLGPTASPTTGLLLVDSTAYDAADNDVVSLDFDFEVTAIGAGSTASFTGGGLSYRDAQTAVSKSRSFAKATDAQVSTFADLVIAVTCTQSAQSTGNIARLDQLDALIFPANPSE